VSYRQAQEFSAGNIVNYYCEQRILTHMQADPLTDETYLSAKRLVKQIRNGRKIFKLFQYVVEFKDLVYELKDFSASRLKVAL